MVQWVKLLLVTPTFLIRVLVQVLAALLPTQLPANVRRQQQVTVQVHESLLSVGQTQVEFVAFGFLSLCLSD